ncbi:hypothetical protein KY333_02845 [Candidatus Woesearchaeota archaeon]|nr:hypothetical protein [Candidatus Woesearchaeota archaeon]MBW2994615.1 hypothetical protein [Candidatus Woesearchaeota archaeon]
MPEEIVIQETLAKKVVYFTTVHVPQEDHDNVELRDSAVNKMQSVKGYDQEFNSFVTPFPTQIWGKTCWYVSSTNKQHTQDIAEAILQSFDVEYKIKK